VDVPASVFVGVFIIWFESKSRRADYCETGNTCTIGFQFDYYAKGGIILEKRQAYPEKGLKEEIMKETGRSAIGSNK
jgi:hypothetical protein